MTVVDVSRSVVGLADRIGGSVDTVTGAAIDPYRKSRITSSRGFGEGSATLVDRASDKETT
jgi:hypothetical protein